nr:MAG TPA: hypothetical protein [Caudoviricetes sp.]
MAARPHFCEFNSRSAEKNIFRLRRRQPQFGRNRPDFTGLELTPSIKFVIERLFRNAD